MDNLLSKNYYVYIIANPNDRTYIGYTVNPKRRLRQHCGELVGGARATRISKDWKFLLIMTCKDWTASRAMQIEWLTKYPQRKKRVLSCFRGSNGRINSLTEICSRVNNENIIIYVRDDMVSKAQNLNLPTHIIVHSLNDLEL